MDFLVDDTIVDVKQGVYRVLGVPQKRKEPILSCDKPWENKGIDALFTPIYDKDKKCYRMWYRSFAKQMQQLSDQSDIDSSERKRSDRQEFLCYAESNDGIIWERPTLGLFEYEGNKDNNIISEHIESCFNVILDTEESDSQKRYKAIGYGSGEESILCSDGKVGITVAFSADGLLWSRPTTIMCGRNDVTDADSVMPFREPTTGKWIGYFRPRTRPKRRFLGYAESDDFIHWTYPRMLLAPDAHDTIFTEFYSMAVTLVAQRRVGIMWVYHNNPEHSILTNELVYSRYGLNYQRVMPRQCFIPLGKSGELDSRRVWPTRMLEVDDKMLIYYGGGNVEHGSDRIDAITSGKMQPGWANDRLATERVDPGCIPISNIFLAELPWGHFAGLKAEFEGVVETTWLDNYGSRGVEIAAAIEDGGYIRVEILNVYGQVLAGWDVDSSRLEPGPRGTYRVIWGKGGNGRYGDKSDAGEEIGHVVKLRFHLYRSTLYGIQIGEEEVSPKTSS